MVSTEDMQPKITITEETLNYMDQLSKFAYYDEINFRLSDHSKLLSHDEIEKATLIGNITPSDFFVLQSVANFSWANSEIITRDIAKRKQREPEKAYPVAKMENIKSCLSRLSRNSLVRGFEYKSSTGSAIKVYCTSESGIYFLKKKLYYDGNVETFNSLNPPEEIFRRLASNYVAQRLSYCGELEKFIPGNWLYINSLGKIYVYSQLIFKKEEEESFVLVEPFYIRSNRSITSKSEMLSFNTTRYSVVRALKEKQEGKRRFSVVVVVEDREGLRYAIDYYLREFPEDIRNIYFTTENAVYMSNKRFASAFLKIDRVENNIPIVKACTSLDFIN